MKTQNVVRVSLLGCHFFQILLAVIYLILQAKHRLLSAFAKAAELTYTGRVFWAVEEASSGLFNCVVPQERVVSKATEIAAEIAENTSAVSVALSEALLWHGLMEEYPQSVYLIESRCFYWAGRQRNAYEGIQSFLEKRPPKFTMSVSDDMPDF